MSGPTSSSHWAHTSPGARFASAKAQARQTLKSRLAQLIPGISHHDLCNHSGGATTAIRHHLLSRQEADEY